MALSKPRPRILWQRSLLIRCRQIAASRRAEVGRLSVNVFYEGVFSFRSTRRIPNSPQASAAVSGGRDSRDRPGTVFLLDADPIEEFSAPLPETAHEVLASSEDFGVFVAA